MGIFNGWVIVSDIDGTLLPNGTMCPSDETLNAIQNWRNEGGKFVLASGRYLGSTLKVHRNIALDTPMIYNNGACIYLPESNDFLSLKTLGTEITSVIDDLVDTVPYCGVAGYSKDAIYTVRENPTLLRHYERQQITPLRTDDYSLFCKVLITVDAHEMSVLREALSKKPYFQQFQFTQSTAEFYEITPIGVTKACQLDTVCSLLNCQKDHLITVGDNENDVSMLQSSKFSFAVANATDAAKAAARFVTKARGDSESAIGEVIAQMTKIITGRELYGQI